MKKAFLLAAAAILYAGTAWMVAPGFYDGFTPPQPYNFVCPPPQAGANLPPTSGHLVIKVIGGVSDANSAFTDDGQVVIGFLPGSFKVNPGQTTITVDITPVSHASRWISVAAPATSPDRWPTWSISWMRWIARRR